MVLDDVPGVVETAVVGVPHPDFGEAVVAVVVRDGDVHRRDTRHSRSTGSSPASSTPRSTSPSMRFRATRCRRCRRPRCAPISRRCSIECHPLVDGQPPVVQHGAFARIDAVRHIDETSAGRPRRPTRRASTAASIDPVGHGRSASIVGPSRMVFGDMPVPPRRCHAHADTAGALSTAAICQADSTQSPGRADTPRRPGTPGSQSPCGVADGFHDRRLIRDQDLRDQAAVRPMRSSSRRVPTGRSVARRNAASRTGRDVHPSCSGPGRSARSSRAAARSGDRRPPRSCRSTRRGSWH